MAKMKNLDLTKASKEDFLGLVKAMFDEIDLFSKWTEEGTRYQI